MARGVELNIGYIISKDGVSEPLKGSSSRGD